MPKRGTRSPHTADTPQTPITSSVGGQPGCWHSHSADGVGCGPRDDIVSRHGGWPGSPPWFVCPSSCSYCGSSSAARPRRHAMQPECTSDTEDRLAGICHCCHGRNTSAWQRGGAGTGAAGFGEQHVCASALLAAVPAAAAAQAAHPPALQAAPGARSTASTTASAHAPHGAPTAVSSLPSRYCRHACRRGPLKPLIIRRLPT